MRRARVPQEALRLVLSCIALLFLESYHVQGQVVLRVPGDFPSIEEAVAAAPPGAIIQIAEGIYRVQLVLEKDLTLEGLSDTVILRARALTEPIVRVQGSAHVTLRKLILDDGTRSLIVQGSAQVILENSQVRDATLAGILVQDRAKLSCVNSKILENHGRAGITAQDQAHLSFNECTIRGNDSEGVFVMGQARLEVQQSLFERNRGAALVLSDDSQAQIVTTRFTSNNGLGIQLQGRAQLSIRQSEFFSNKSEDSKRSQAIEVQQAAYMEATQVRFRSEAQGITVKDTATALIKECEFVEGIGVIVSSSGSTITLRSNLFRKGSEGVAISSPEPKTKVFLYRNTFEDMLEFGLSVIPRAVTIESQAAITIEENRFERNLIAISVTEAQNLVVRSNVFLDNYGAIEIEKSLRFTESFTNQIVVEDNVLERNWVGIDAGSDELRGILLVVRGNHLKETEIIAIAIGGMIEATLTGNQISEAGKVGIALMNEARATLTNNTLSKGELHGIVLSSKAQGSLRENRISGYGGCGLYIGPKAKLISDEGNALQGNQGGDRCGRVGRSWQTRLEEAPPGSTVEIPPGVYYESLWINKPIEIRSLGAVFRGNGFDPVVVVTGSAHVRLQGITLQDSTAGIVATGKPPYGGWFPGLITEEGQQKLELSDVKILKNGIAGLWGDYSVTELVIERSELRENGRFGVRFTGSVLKVSKSTIAGHETGVFFELARRERSSASVTITETNFVDNQLGIDAEGPGEFTLEASQIAGGALGIEIRGGRGPEAALRAHIVRTIIRDHRQERVTSLGLALLAIFGEFVGSGLALEEGADVTITDSEITENEFHGVAIGQGSSVVLERNKIAKNGKYGVALGIASCMRGLAVPSSFQGRVSGRQNTIPGTGETEANLQGAFCPKELEFLRTEQGGSYP
jgi:parallel beta-helix repeat protein